MTDRVATARAKVSSLRIKELHECLDGLRLKKTGRKSDLQQRLLAVLQPADGLSSSASAGAAQLELAARLIDDAYRAMYEQRSHWGAHAAQSALSAAAQAAQSHPQPHGARLQGTHQSPPSHHPQPQPAAPPPPGAHPPHHAHQAAHPPQHPQHPSTHAPGQAGSAQPGYPPEALVASAERQGLAGQGLGAQLPNGSAHTAGQLAVLASGLRMANGGHTAPANGTQQAPPGGPLPAAPWAPNARAAQAAAAVARMFSAGGPPGSRPPHMESGGGLLSSTLPPGLAASAGPPAMPAPNAWPGMTGKATIRCICGEAVQRGEMVQCPGCGVWLHADCAGMPALAPGTVRPPDSRHCERCRAERADPFWEPVAVDLMAPAKLKPTGRYASIGTKTETQLFTERHFTPTADQHDKYRKNPAYRLQALCLQLNDPVPFRFHWPTGAELKVGQNQYRVYGRQPHLKLGVNQRDEAANIGVLCPPGRSRITLQATDSGSYVLLLQLGRKRSLEQVKALMRPPLSLEDAVADVKKQGGGGEAPDDDDDDLRVTHTCLSLKCPLSGSRIATPARFAEVPGFSCFDLDTFLAMAERSRKWQCPHTMRNSCVQQLQIDSYVAAVLAGLANRPDVSEVDIAPDGTWRPAAPGSKQPPERWYSPGEAALSAAEVAAQRGAVPQAAPGSEAGPLIKPEPGVDPGVPQGPASAPRPPGDFPGSSDEEEDEMEELRKAAAAVKRGRPPSPDVIIIDSDSDGEAASSSPTPAPAQKRMSNGQAPGAMPRTDGASRAPQPTEQVLAGGRMGSSSAAWPSAGQQQQQQQQQQGQVAAAGSSHSREAAQSASSLAVGGRSGEVAGGSHQIRIRFAGPVPGEGGSENMHNFSIPGLGPLQSSYQHQYQQFQQQQQQQQYQQQQQQQTQHPQLSGAGYAHQQYQQQQQQLNGLPAHVQGAAGLLPSYNQAIGHGPHMGQPAPHPSHLHAFSQPQPQHPSLLLPHGSGGMQGPGSPSTRLSAGQAAGSGGHAPGRRPACPPHHSSRQQQQEQRSPRPHDVIVIDSD